MAGEVLEPVGLRLAVSPEGGAGWHVRPLRDVELQRIAGLIEAGLTYREIRDELGISLGKVGRLARQAGEKGLVEARPRRGGRGGRHWKSREDAEPA